MLELFIIICNILLRTVINEIDALNMAPILPKFVALLLEVSEVLVEGLVFLNLKMEFEV